MTSTDTSKITVRSPADLIAALPYLLGFHPVNSLVVAAIDGKRIVFVARGDLPTSVDAAHAAELARHFTDILRRQEANSAVIVGYGPVEVVTPAVDAVRAELRRTGLIVLDALRVTDGRYWSYFCENPSCCPPEGSRFDSSTSAIAAAATFAGQVALPDRETLVRQLAPVTGRARDAMRQATRQARKRLAALLTEAPPVDPAGRRLIEAAGRPVVRTAMERHRTGGSLTDDEVAWLSVLLTQLPVRDHAWERIGGEPWQLSLWTDVLRRAEPDLAAAPASLLAFSAWRVGQGALAAVAVERALQVQPDYSMALLMSEVLRNAISPEQIGRWPAPSAPPAAAD